MIRITLPPHRDRVTRCPHCEQPHLTQLGLLYEQWSCDCCGIPDHCHCSASAAAAQQARDEQQQKESDKRKAKARARYLATGLPLRYAKRTLSRYNASTDDERNALDAAKEFCQRYTDPAQASCRGLLIIGDIGVGKTYLASSIATTLAHAQHRICWRNLSTILEEFRQCYGAQHNSSDNEETLIRKYAEAPLLILDDLGKERITEWAQALLFNIINKRSDEEIPIIVTANHGRDGLAERLTPAGGDTTTARAIVDRIAGSTIVVRMQGASRRTTISYQHQQSHPSE